jgi:hypothetical protein
MNTVEAREQIRNLAEKHGTRSVEFSEKSLKILRDLWQSGYEHGRDHS